MTYPGESWQSENTRRDLAAAHARRDAEQADAERKRAARVRAAERRPAAPVLVAAEHVIRPEPPAQSAPPEPPRQRRLRYVDPASFYSVLEEDTHDHDN
ncbi:hypothetical protein [Microbacterium sufflavum]|uniref:Uncharacterized protein n=1 Tax=Microbacterium sufflavum TaxID=2851649 RepID=A0ABY4IHW5_9MICO|nr:hypothetical protein [Microbacterium sufflavum]UPL12189.1 hypothetical protein KV394_14180 [Microbacterium sufflavum]